nr:RNA-directed DNA polymerase, eukaryota [Tanacetum cinerariifolium]
MVGLHMDITTDFELSASHSSTWSSILKEINILKAQGVDLISHCKIRVGNGLCTSFWNELWIGDAHLCCGLAYEVMRLVCRWWKLVWIPLNSYPDWLSWFKSLRMSSNVKGVLEGVFYTTWWSIWCFRNQFLFAANKPRKESLFDDIVMRSFTWCIARVRGGAESLQLVHLLDLLEPVILSNMEHRWIWVMNGDGVFHVKDVCILLDE